MHGLGEYEAFEVTQGLEIENSRFLLTLAGGHIHNFNDNS